MEDKDNVYDFGLRMKSLRKQKGLTQEQLGDMVGVSKDAISRYESNTQTPSLERVRRIALVLNTSVDYLLGLENEPVIKISGLSPKKRKFVYDFIHYCVDENDG